MFVLRELNANAEKAGLWKATNNTASNTNLLPSHSYSFIMKEILYVINIITRIIPIIIIVIIRYNDKKGIRLRNYIFPILCVKHVRTAGILIVCGPDISVSLSTFDSHCLDDIPD
jgi:hypothetical protein